MENILCLFGGAVLGAVIYASATRKQNNHQVIKMLKRILSKLDSEDAAELEKQMDSWLATLDKSVGAIEKVSEQVDSK